MKRDLKHVLLSIALIFVFVTTACALTGRSQPTQELEQQPEPIQEATPEPAPTDTVEAAQPGATPEPKPTWTSVAGSESSSSSESMDEEVQAGEGADGWPLTALGPEGGARQGPYSDLWVDSDGNVWVSGENGLFLKGGASWIEYTDQPVENILGKDDAGRLWAVLGGGERIGHLWNEFWMEFDTGSGWEPLPESQYLSPGFGDGVVTDPEGHVWLATGLNEVRRFDGNTALWSSLTAEEIGFPAADADYQGHFLTDVLVSATGKVWVSECSGEGETLVGHGIRYLDGGEWLQINATANDCVLDMELGPEGVIYAGAFDALLQYDPARGKWTRIDLPVYAEPRRQLVFDLKLDTNGTPWIETYVSGGASLFGSTALLRYDGEQWYPVFRPDIFSVMPYVLSPEGGFAYLCAESMVYEYDGAGASAIGQVGAVQCALGIDRTGAVWVAELNSPDGGLWVYRE
jgi:hypothetical protein